MNAVGELQSVVVLAAAVVPHPPLLVPALAAGAAPDIAPLLAACDSVVAGLLGRAPRTVVCLGPGERTALHPADDWGTLGGFGVAVEAPARHDPPAPALPLSLTIGRWLLERAGWTGEVLMQQVAADLPTSDCAALGARLASGTGPRSVWLVLGDGSFCRGPTAPGHDDPRASGFDAEVARAFADADLEGLLGLDTGLAGELGVAGRPAWQVLAGAVGAFEVGGPIESEVHYEAAPFGVGYLVAHWRFAS
jgi:hypothetical protein